MRIVLVASAHSVHVRKMANWFVSNDHEVVIYSEESSQTESSPQEYHPKVILRDLWPKKAVVRKVLFTLSLNWYLLLNRVDVVWFVYASSYGLMTRRIFTSAKKIVSVWGSDILVNSYKPAYKRRVSSALGKADIVLSTSEYLRTHTSRLTISEISLTPYGPSDRYFDARIAQLSSRTAQRARDDFSKLVVCNKWLKHVYGLDVLLEAILVGRSYFRAQNVGFVLCGDGVDGIKLKEYVRDHDLTDLVHFTGYLDEEEVVGLLDIADLAVFPSRSESFGVCLLECFARGVPVICSNAGGFWELSDRGRYGRIVSSMSPSEYYQAIRESLEIGPRYSLEGAREYSRRFAWGRCMNHVERVLMSVVGVLTKSAEASRDFPIHPEKPYVLYLHSEVLSPVSKALRARDVRISGMREALSDEYNVHEYSLTEYSAKGLQVVVRRNLAKYNYSLVYIEGTSSMLSWGYLVFRALRKIFYEVSRFGVPCFYFMPDAHEYWDDYVVAARSASKVHLARHRKDQLVKLLAKYQVHLGVPSLGFASALSGKLRSGVRESFLSLNTIPLPPAVPFNAALSVKPSPESACVSVVFRYCGGLGSFYSLHRFLIAIQSVKRGGQLELLVRPTDIAALDYKYRNLIRSSGANIREGDLESLDDVGVIGVLLLEPTEYISVSMPVKLFSYAEKGWPVLCYEGTEVAKLVEEFDMGWVLPPSADVVAEFIGSDLAGTQYEFKSRNAILFAQKNTWRDRVEVVRNEVG